MDNKNPICPYCKEPSVMVDGEHVYPHREDLHHKVFYVCTPCDARVGCHPGTDKPLGRLANSDLRKAKQAAHAAFDPLWRELDLFKNRRKAYAWLSEQLGISKKKCHIGMFDEPTCRRAQKIAQNAQVNGIS